MDNEEIEKNLIAEETRRELDLMFKGIIYGSFILILGSTIFVVLKALGVAFR